MSALCVALWGAQEDSQGLIPTPPDASFSLTDLTVYPDYVAIINLSHEYNYKLNLLSPYSKHPTRGW